MTEDNQLTSEDEALAKKAFTAFLAGRMKACGRILTQLPDEQRVRVWRYGLHPKIKDYHNAIMSR